MMYKKIYFYIFFAFFLAGCGYTVPTYQQRVQSEQKLISSKNLKKKVFKTSYFEIYSVSSDLSKCKNKTVDVYIEGDGLSWVTSDTVSSNPTPINPTGLKLFLKDFHKCKIYFARPCQYTNDPKCKPEYWTGYRFSSKIINSFNQVLNKIKKRYNPKSFRLFGYSGGGAVAALLAAKRRDVSFLVTICGNLNIKKWAEENYLTPLKGSLNPADFSKELERVKQIHLIGGSDEIIRKSIFESYLKKFKNKKNINYIVFKNYNHHCCWVKNWKKILKDIDEREKNQF